MERELDLEKKVDEYLKELQKDGTWAADYEINKIALCLEANIICYKEENKKYYISEIYFGSKEYSKLQQLYLLILLNFLILNDYNLLFQKKVSFFNFYKV